MLRSHGGGSRCRRRCGARQVSMAVPIADPGHVSRKRMSDRLQAEYLAPIPPPRPSRIVFVEERDDLLVRVPRSTHHVLRLFVVIYSRESTVSPTRFSLHVGENVSTATERMHACLVHLQQLRENSEANRDSTLVLLNIPNVDRRQPHSGRPALCNSHTNACLCLELLWCPRCPASCALYLQR